MNRFNQFLDMVLDVYDEKRIVFINANYAKYGTNPNCQSVESLNVSPRVIELTNNLFDACFNAAMKKCPKAHFIDCFPFLIANSNHKWGKYQLHFIDEVYLYLHDSLFEVLNSKNKNKELESIENIKNKYALLVANKMHSFQLNLIDSKNLLNTNTCKPGEYEKNGIKVKIESDYEFSVEGAAKEETVFYLFSNTNNPTGEWGSFSMPLKAGVYNLTSGIRYNENIFVQFIFTTNDNVKKWVNVYGGTTITLDRDYSYLLVRLMVLKDSNINDKYGKIGLYKVDK